jgi:hypothetical protein
MKEREEQPARLDLYTAEDSFLLIKAYNVYFGEIGASQRHKCSFHLFLVRRSRSKNIESLDQIFEFNSLDL